MGFIKSVSVGLLNYQSEVYYTLMMKRLTYEEWSCIYDEREDIGRAPDVFDVGGSCKSTFNTESYRI